MSMAGRPCERSLNTITSTEAPLVTRISSAPFDGTGGRVSQPGGTRRPAPWTARSTGTQSAVSSIVVVVEATGSPRFVGVVGCPDTDPRPGCADLPRGGIRADVETSGDSSGARADRETLVAGALDVVAAEARRYRVWRVERADLLQAGMVGLLVAADRFDPGRGVPFRAFAALWVRKEMQRAVAGQAFAAAGPATLIGPLVALRGLLGDDRTDLDVA